MDLSLFDRAVETTRPVVAGISRDQLDAATPCTEWNVRDLLNHLIGNYESVAAAAAGEAPAGGSDHTAEDYVKAFESSVARARSVFAAPGAMEKTFAMPWGEVPGQVLVGLMIGDTAVHGVDLARATGQEARVPDDVAEAIYGMTAEMMEPKGRFPREGTFGPPIEVPDDAPIQDKMLAYLGRRP